MSPPPPPVAAALYSDFGLDLSEDGYPTEEALDAIKNYDLASKPLSGFLALARRSWSDYGMWKQTRTRLRIATGGWSGCEYVVQAMRDNVFFYPLYWLYSKRGGLEVFTLSVRWARQSTRTPHETFYTRRLI